MFSIARSMPRGPRPLASLLGRTAFTPSRRNSDNIIQIRRVQVSHGSGPGIKPIRSTLAMEPVGPYSQAIEVGNTVYCSGQLPADKDGNIVRGTITEQTRACILALQHVLLEGGATLKNIVKVQVFLTDMNDLAEMNKEYKALIKHFPARSCVAVKGLPAGVDVEIECIAVKGGGLE